jgi:hypothetical protein
MPATGSMRLGSLFLTLPTRALTGQQIISSEGSGQQRLELRHVLSSVTRNSAPR